MKWILALAFIGLGALCLSEAEKVCSKHVLSVLRVCFWTFAFLVGLMIV
jgi:hypothetical protein